MILSKGDVFKIPHEIEQERESANSEELQKILGSNFCEDEGTYNNIPTIFLLDDCLTTLNDTREIEKKRKSRNKKRDGGEDDHSVNYKIDLQLHEQKGTIFNENERNATSKASKLSKISYSQLLKDRTSELTENLSNHNSKCDPLFLKERIK